MAVNSSIHAATWAEFVDRFNFSPRRAAILGRVIIALHHLADAGVSRVFIGGSFVTSKKQPKDMDVLIDTFGADPARVHPMFIDLHNGRIATLSLFGAEFFPIWLVEASVDEPFIDFFQHDKHMQPVGIVEIHLDSLPSR